MKKYLERIPEEIKDIINKIRDIATRKNTPAYLVGGLVRDLILGVKNLDLDIVIEGDGIKIAQDFAASLGVKITVHRQFGTATVFVKPGLKVDFSSSRKEYYPQPGHLPLVEAGSLRDDLNRRDFTINAMAVGLKDGRLVDYFGGLDDLRHKVIRVLHPLSFIDDPTRILRAVRFEQRYDFKIEPESLAFLKEAYRSGLLERIHPHRTRDDLILVLKEKEPLKEIKRIEKIAGFNFILPRFKISPKTCLFLKALRKEINYFHQNYTGRRPLDTWVIYLIGLLDVLEAEKIKKVCAKFGLRRGVEIRLLSYKRSQSRRLSAELSRASIKPARIFTLLEPLSYETILALRASCANPVFKRNITDFLDIYNGMRIFVSGNDLRGLGLLPGPGYQKIFTQVIKAKLNGQVKTKDEELALIKQLLRKRS
jgi:tRNA nucleotidyltransferase (CCA-adding enzyme)